MPCDPICFEKCFSNSSPKSLSVLQLLNTLSLLPHILTYLSHFPYFCSHHFCILSTSTARSSTEDIAILSRSGQKHNDYCYFSICMSLSRSFEELRWLELCRCHVSSKIPTKKKNPKQECDFFGPGGDAFTFAFIRISRRLSPLYMSKLHFKRVFKNPNYFISPAKLLRQQTKKIGYILLQFNSFMTLFTQMIHKKQTQTIKQRVPGQSMETHISILVRRIPMARGACWTTVHRLQKSDTVEQLSTALKVEQQYHLHHHCIYASVQTAQA